jgi:hypothetical protein
MKFSAIERHPDATHFTLKMLPLAFYFRAMTQNVPLAVPVTIPPQ